jgi:hypothetical protein
MHLLGEVYISQLQLQVACNCSMSCNVLTDSEPGVWLIPPHAECTACTELC